MTEKFDPAPYDAHAADPKEAIKADKEAHARLEAGLVGTFPASDPVSEVQPSPSIHDVQEEQLSLFDRVRDFFRPKPDRVE